MSPKKWINSSVFRSNSITHATFRTWSERSNIILRVPKYPMIVLLDKMNTLLWFLPLFLSVGTKSLLHSYFRYYKRTSSTKIPLRVMWVIIKTLYYVHTYVHMPVSNMTLSDKWIKTNKVFLNFIKVANWVSLILE